MRYACCDERRLRAVKEAGLLNAIEYAEVSDSEAPTEELRQRTLFVRLVRPAAGLTAANVRLTGGERVPEVAVSWAAPATPLPPGEAPALVANLPAPDHVLLVRTASRGDFSQYTLRLVAGAGSDLPPAGFDPLLAEVELFFKVECPSDFDCAPVDDCPPPGTTVPSIDYLAKDYGSFRRLMLDRLSLLAPGWTERSPADVGVTLVEALAYVADELSYRQDAVATEAYLATARRRTSLRRLARLVDYRVHEGANARAWAQIHVEGEGVPVGRGTALLTAVAGIPPTMSPGDRDHRAALAAGAETFETVEDAVLFESHRRFEFWTWGDTGCCLPRGATSATLVGDHPALKAGDVLVLLEVAGPTTGVPADADPTRRAVVRLTSVLGSVDPSGGRFSDPPTTAAVDVTEIAWSEADALAFPLCISVNAHPGLAVAEAWGNIVLADHGRTVAGEELGVVPAPVLAYATRSPAGPCATTAASHVPVRFRPALATGPVTHARPAPTRPVADGPADAALIAELDARTFGPVLRAWLEARGFPFPGGSPIVRGGSGSWAVTRHDLVVGLRRTGGDLQVLAPPGPARSATATDPRSAGPAVLLSATTATGPEDWIPQPDLLASSGDAPEFVVEVEHDGTSTLRFGDGEHGRRPSPGTSFTAAYRVGNGTAGNVGRAALAHVATLQGAVSGVTNPLPAVGGTDPEPADAVRRDAPEAFLVQRRAVTAEDYARTTERAPAVQRAGATFRWTGSWHTVFVTADRTDGLAVDDRFETAVRRHLEPFRMAGYDLEVDGPQFVPLQIELFVCARSDHFRSLVKAAVLDVLSSRARADGALGLFHPDRFTFGQPVYLSAVVAATQAVPGVDSVRATVFQCQRDDATNAIDAGVLPMGRLEIARLDNDPNFPEHGVLVVTMGGGK